MERKDFTNPHMVFVQSADGNGDSKSRLNKERLK